MSRGCWVAMFCVLLLLFAEQGCTSRSSSPEHLSKDGTGAVPVKVSKVVKRDVPIDIQTVGTVEASSTVTVRSQVSGELVRVYFHEGDFVKKGDELFDIDARSYEAQLNQSQANLAKDEAALVQIEANLARDVAQQKYAESEAVRYANLLEKRLVSKEQTEQVSASAEAALAAVQADRAAINSARATVEASRAAVANARVMLSYTKIQSPLNGRTGNLVIKEGNVISPTMDLMTINQVEPIYVTFSIPEIQLSSVRTGQTVLASSQDSSSPPESGKLFFIDNTVDSTTGTIRVKGIFPNADHRLWPGEYVRATLRLAIRPDALTIPNQAVQTGQEGTFAFVVKPDRTVESRPVVPGMRVGGDVVVERGLQPGELVVTEGHLRLAAGSRVLIRDSD